MLGSCASWLNDQKLGELQLKYSWNSLMPFRLLQNLDLKGFQCSIFSLNRNCGFFFPKSAASIRCILSKNSTLSNSFFIIFPLDIPIRFFSVFHSLVLMPLLSIPPETIRSLCIAFCKTPVFIYSW